MRSTIAYRLQASRERTIAAHAVFANHAQELREKRLAVVPIQPDRTPHVSGFNKWRHRPGAKLVGKWCEKFPDDNIAALPGLSGKGALVADCDTFEAAAEFEGRFGKSDLRVRTRRGLHLWYAKTDARLPGNLKRLGLEVDIKTGNQLVIVPPSVHPSGHVYRLEGCEWDALGKLRRLDIDALRKFIGATAQPPAGTIATDGQRRTNLNKFLCRHVHDYADDESDKFFALASAFNDASQPPRDATEVMKTACEVWTDRHKLQRWVGGPATTRTNHDEIDRINTHGKNAGDALLLLQKLRLWHSARAEPFTLITDLLAPKLAWSRKRVEKALAILLKLRLIVKVSKFKVTAAGRVAARYRLASPTPTGPAPGGAVKVISPAVLDVWRPRHATKAMKALQSFLAEGDHEQPEMVN